MNGFRSPKIPPKRALERNQTALQDRVAVLEETIGNLVGGIQRMYAGQGKRLGNVEELVEAVVTEIGLESVNARIEALRLDRMDANLKAQEAALAENVSNGTAVETDTVKPGTVVIGCEKTADGVPLPPGKAFVHYQQIAEEFRAQLEGKPVGTVIETKPVDSNGGPLPGGTFEVLAIYELKQPVSVPTQDAEAVDPDADLAAGAEA